MWWSEGRIASLQDFPQKLGEEYKQPLQRVMVWTRFASEMLGQRLVRNVQADVREVIESMGQASGARSQLEINSEASVNLEHLNA